MKLFILDAKWREKPNYIITLSKRSNNRTSSVQVKIKNTGHYNIVVYSKDARLMDADFEPFDRNLYLVNENCISVSSITIKPGEEKTFMFMISGSSTWYDSRTEIICYFSYAGQKYVMTSSYYDGSYYTKVN